MTQTLPKEGYVGPRLKSLLQKLFGRHHDLVDRYEISLGMFSFYVDFFLSITANTFIYE